MYFNFSKRDFKYIVTLFYFKNISFSLATSLFLFRFYTCACESYSITVMWLSFLFLYMLWYILRILELIINFYKNHQINSTLLSISMVKLFYTLKLVLELVSKYNMSFSLANSSPVLVSTTLLSFKSVLAAIRSNITPCPAFSWSLLIQDGISSNDS